MTGPVSAPVSRRAAAGLVAVGVVFGLAAGGVVFFGLPVGAAVSGPAPTAVPSAVLPAPAPVKGAPAPDFTLQALDGRTVRLADYRGQAVLVNFWATWCGPCEAEMPAIESRYLTYQSRGLAVLAVNLAEPVADVRGFVTRLGLSFPILLDPEEAVFDLYRVQGYPTSYFIDRQGVIQDVRVGFMAIDMLDRYLLDTGFSGS